MKRLPKKIHITAELIDSDGDGAGRWLQEDFSLSKVFCPRCGRRCVYHNELSDICLMCGWENPIGSSIDDDIREWGGYHQQIIARTMRLAIKRGTPASYTYNCETDKGRVLPTYHEPTSEE